MSGAWKKVTDPTFAPPVALASVGTSPFRQKGNGYLGDFTYFDMCVPGGTKAVIGSFAEGPLREYLEQPFRGSEWYDAFPCAVLHAAAARLRKIDYLEHRRQIGAFHASSTAGMIYRALLKVVSNESLSFWGPRVSSIYFDFGKTDTKIVGPREVHALRRGLPTQLVQFVMGATQGFTEESLRRAGALKAALTIGEPEPEGRVHGHDVWTVPLAMRWG
jgi:hypothetical protein